MNIPAHTGCKNCGECCSVIAVYRGEVEKIRQYLKMHPTARDHAIRQAGQMLLCPFRDNEQKRCVIYSVRPVVCQLMGVCSQMECLYGNSGDIDGYPFLNTVQSEGIVILNMVDWSAV